MQAAPPRTNEAQALASLRSLDVLDSAPEGEFDALVRAASLACGAPIALISLIDADRQWFKANIGLPGVTETPREDAFCAHAVLGDELLEVADAAQDPRFADNPLVAGEPRIRFYAGAPVRLSDGHRVGTLCIIDRQPRELDRVQREILQCLALAAARALEGRQARRLLRRTMLDNEARLRRLYEATPAMLHSIDVQGRVLAVSDAWLDKMGYTREEVVGRLSTDFLTAASREHASEIALPTFFATGRCDAVAYQMCARDGSVMDVLLSAILERDAEGRPLGSLAVVEDVTLRLRAERELVEERQRLAHILDGTDVGTWEWNVRTGELRINQRFAGMVGRTIDAAAPTTIESWVSHIHPDDLVRSAALLKTHFERRSERYEFEVRLRHIDGHWVWAMDRGRVMTRRPDGTPEWMFGTRWDIGERKRLELQLTAALDEVHDLYDNSPCGYHSIDADGRFLHINATALGWLGCTRDELIGQRRVVEFFTPEGQLQFHRNFGRLRSEGRIEGLEFELVPKLGPARRVSVSATAVKDAAGTFQMSRTVMFDITDLHRARQQLSQMNREQAAMLDNDLIGIVRLHERQALWTNRGLERAFGYSPGELHGQPSRLLYLDDGSYQAIGESAYPVLRAGGEFRAQLQMRRKDGAAIWIDMSGVLLSPENGVSMWLLADITPMKQAEMDRLMAVKLEAENRQLLEANRLKSLFLSNMSHELRTPLNAVIGFAQLLQAGAAKPDSPKYASYLAQIGASGRHLLQLIESMLDYAKAESDKIEFRPEPVNLRVAVQDVIDMMQAKCERQHVVITSSVGDDLGEVRLDPMRLRQVLLNLVGNAVKFSREAGHVQVRARAEGGTHLRVEVEDNGIGIAAADLPRLFTQFQQLSAGHTKSHQGTGLGLALVRRMIESQGGQIGVDSTLGGGSVFHFTLPRVPSAAQ